MPNRMVAATTKRCLGMGNATVCVCALAALVTGLLADSAAAQDDAPPPVKACLIRLDGAINKAYSEAIKRNIEEAKESGAKIIILEMNTPGGEVGASIDLGDFIFMQDELRIVAYVNPMAYSGGTMVALACDEIYIDKAIGKMGDVAPVAPTGQEMGEKLQAPIRKTLENYADERGYPIALVHAMVTKEIEVFRIYLADDPAPRYITGTELDLMPENERTKIVRREIVVEQGQLLALTAKDAVELGFARKAVGSREELMDELGVQPGNVRRLYLTGSERVLTLLDTFSPALIVLGLILLFIEFNNPGFGLPGIVGVGCFVAFFLIKFTLQYARLLELLLLAAGVTLLVLEIFIIPGFGITGAAGILLIFVSLVLMLQQFTIPGTPLEWRALGTNVVTILVTFLLSAFGLMLIVRYMGSIPLLGRLVMRRTLADVTAASAAGRAGEELAALVGQVGVAITPLRPAGRAEFGDVLTDVVTEGDFLERGAPVEVIEVHGPRVVVKGHKEA